MGKIKRASPKDKIYIECMYGKIRAQDIADELGLKIHQVYKIGKDAGKSRPQNQEVEMSEISNQIILSGIIGDGRLKRNGKNKINTYYSECHANDELDYLTWKFNNLGDLTKNSTIYGKNKESDGTTSAKEFTTLTTPTLNRYINLTKKEVIQGLNELGLLLYMLDDGWSREYVSGLRFTICLGELTSEEQELIQDRYEKILGVKSKIYKGKNNPNSLAFGVNEGIKFVNLYKRYLPSSLDIGKKKLKRYV